MFTIHSSGLWAEVFGSRRPGIHTLDMYPEAWEQRSIALLRALPGDCRDRHIIVALLTLPLAEADALHVQEQHVAASLLKKVKRDSGVCVCVQHMLKWPVKEREIAQTLHDGNFFVIACAHVLAAFWRANATRHTKSHLSGLFSLDKLCKCDRDIQALSRSEIAFALRVIPSHFSQYLPLALAAGRVRASVDDPHLVARWDQLTQAIHDRNLTGVCSEPCLIDGRVVQDTLQIQPRSISKSIELIMQARTPSAPFSRLFLTRFAVAI